jgi:DNA-directed RNA polymerase subunit K/omega
MPLMQRPSNVGAFEFVILASLRAAQLMRGCRPKIEGFHKNTVIAQLEVAQGKVGAQTAEEAALEALPDTGPTDDEPVPALAAG